MKVGTHNHVKMKRLKRLLGVPLYRAVGILECLWLMCSECCDEGDIGKFSDDEIADYLEWDGDVSELVRCLSDAGWIDPDDDRRLVVHDWFDHAPEYIRERVRKRRARGAKQRIQRTYGRSKSDNNGHRRDKTPHVPSIPNPTNPNPTIHSSAENRTNERTDSVLVQAGGWSQVADCLGTLGVFSWKPLIEEAKANECDPEHILSVIEYATTHDKSPNELAARIKIARNTLPVAEGWVKSKAKPEKPPPTEQEIRDQRRFDILYDAKRAKKTRAEIEAALLAEGFTP